MRSGVALISLALLLMMWEPISAIGLGGSSDCIARNALEAYCMNHGGCPRDGNCYFPDGGYCDLESFYNGTCPSRTYFEDAVWMAEAYAFLYGDYTPYGQYYVPGVGYSYYDYPYANQVSTPYGSQGMGGSYYWPLYSPGYGPAYSSEMKKS